MLNVPAMQGAAARRRANGDWWDGSDPDAEFYYPLTADFSDSTGFHDATPTGASILGTPPAAFFSGTSQYATPADIPNLFKNSPAHTYETLYAWVMQTGPFDFIGSIWGCRGTLNTSIPSTAFQIFASNSRVELVQSNWGGLPNKIFTAWDTQIMQNVWYHICVSFAPSATPEIWINGAPQTITTRTGAANGTFPNGIISDMDSVTLAQIGAFFAGPTFYEWRGYMSSIGGLRRRITDADALNMFDKTKSYYGVT